MRVLFTTISVKSHMYGMVPMAWAFLAAGHEVRVACQPELVETVARAGLPVVAVGEDVSAGSVDEASASEEEEPVNIFDMPPAELDWASVREGYAVMTEMGVRQCNEPLLGGLVAFARAWRPDLVLWEPITYAGAVAARACGAAHARMLWGQDVWAPVRDRAMELRALQPPDDRTDALTEWLTGCLAQHGSDFDEEAVTGQFTIDPLPAPLRPASTRTVVPVRYVPFHGPAAVPGWLTDPPRRPRVCLTLGVSHREYAGYFAAPPNALLDALLTDLAAQGVEVVATLSREQREALDPLPPGVRAEEFVPLDALLPSCDAVIHHGGAGTFSTALVHGVPQLLLAKMFDTRAKGELLSGLGAGLSLSADGLTGAGAAAAALRLLREPSFAQRAAALRDEARAEPAPAELVPVLERMTARLRA